MSVLTNIKALWGIIIVLIVINLVSMGSHWITSEQRTFSRGINYERFGRRNMAPSIDQHFIPRRLNFSADQQSKFDSLAELHRQSLNQKTNEIRELREQLVIRMRNQEFNNESEDLIQQIGEKQAELELLNFRNFRDVMSICDDAQKEQFVDMMHRAFRPHNNRHGRGQGRGGRW